MAMSEYDEGRIWFKKKGKVITMGLTEKGIEEIGEVEGISMPQEGQDVNQDDAIGELEGTKTSFEIISPVDGCIIAVNEALNEDFDSLLEDPLDEGWICQIKMDSSEDTGEEEDEGE